MKKFALIILFISCNANALVWMEKQKEFDKFGRQYASVFVTENIDENDVKEFKTILDIVKKEELHIKYDSIILKKNLGGSVWSAMEIGAMIRKNNLSTWIPKDEYCMSACVHIFVAGVCRMAEGDIYIHRRIHVTKEEKERTRKETLALRKWEAEYFKLMDVDPILEWIVANNKGVDKRDLMNELSKKYDSMNRNPNFIVRLLSVLFPYKFRDSFRDKYPSCTEQLFLDK